MRKVLVCYTREFTEVRSEYYRGLTSKVSIRFIEDAVDRLGKADIYFICSRYDVTYAEELGFKQRFVNAGSYLDFFVTFEDDSKKRHQIPISFKTTINKPIRIEIADRAGREIKLVGSGIDELLNLGINPVITQYYKHLIENVRVHYIGSCKKDGLVNRTKNGHLGLEAALNRASNQYKNRDVFVIAFNLGHGEFIVRDDGVAEVVLPVVSRDLMIDISEGTLIGFFKPEDNKRLLEFPKGDEKTIKDLRNLGYSDVLFLLEGQKQMNHQSGLMTFNTFFNSDEVINNKMKDFEISFDTNLCLPVSYRAEASAFSAILNFPAILNLSHARKPVENL